MGFSGNKGLGDTIESITTFTGIKKMVDGFSGGSCGCEDRKNKLNEMFPYGKTN